MRSFAVSLLAIPLFFSCAVTPHSSTIVLSDELEARIDMLEQNYITIVDAYYGMLYKSSFDSLGREWIRPYVEKLPEKDLQIFYYQLRDADDSQGIELLRSGIRDWIHGYFEQACDKYQDEVEFIEGDRRRQIRNALKNHHEIRWRNHDIRENIKAIKELQKARGEFGAKVIDATAKKTLDL